MLAIIQTLSLVLPLLSGLAHGGLVMPHKRADTCGQKGDDRSCVSSGPASTPPPAPGSPPGTPGTPKSSPSPSTAAATVPAGCNTPSTLTMTSFRWFNSSHNLDCVGNNFPAGAQVCWNGASNTVCAGAGEAGCTCTPFCYTGLPSAAYQPLGYGPPDTIAIAFATGAACSAANAQSIRRNQLGEGHFDCGSAADYIGFYGDSTRDTGSTGSVYYNAYNSQCNSKTPRYTGTFPLTCTRDAGNNATCTAPVPLNLTLAGWL